MSLGPSFVSLCCRPACAMLMACPTRPFASGATGEGFTSVSDACRTDVKPSRRRHDLYTFRC